MDKGRTIGRAGAYRLGRKVYERWRGRIYDKKAETSKRLHDIKARKTKQNKRIDGDHR